MTVLLHCIVDRCFSLSFSCFEFLTYLNLEVYRNVLEDCSCLAIAVVYKSDAKISFVKVIIGPYQNKHWIITLTMIKVRINLVILILYACVCSTVSNESRPKLILVFLLDINKKGIINSGARMAGAILKSVDHAQEILPEFDLSQWEIIDSACDAKTTTRGLLDIWSRLSGDGQRIHGIIGPYCVLACKIAALFASTFNIPEISIGCYFKQAGDDHFYPTLARVNGDVPSTTAIMLTQFITHVNIERLAVVATDDVGIASEVANRIERRIRAILGAEFDCTVQGIKSRVLWHEDPGIIIADLTQKLLLLKRKGYKGKYCVCVFGSVPFRS